LFFIIELRSYVSGDFSGLRIGFTVNLQILIFITKKQI